MRRAPVSDLGLRIGAPAMFVVVVALALLVTSFPSHGQQPAKVYRIGWLGVGGPVPTNADPHDCPVKDPGWQAFREGLRERGYIEGQNVSIECRWTAGREEQAASIAAELVSLRVDLIVAYGTALVRAATQATGTIPIVMVAVIDPVGRGLIASLAHPGGNVTGLAYTAGVEIAGKRLQLLKEAVPKVSRVAVLAYAGGPPNPGYRRETEAAAQALDITPQFYEVRDPNEFEAAFGAMTKARAEALLVMPSPSFAFHAKRLVDLAARSRLPAVYPGSYHAEAGGLIVYGVNEPDIFRRLGLYLEKIFKGANPGDLPVEQPTKFDLIINLKTAKALGLTISQSLLLRADEVIQ